MQLVTPPTQQSRCPSQTSIVAKLLSAHSDGVEMWSSKSTQLNCQCVLRSLCHYPVIIRFRTDGENPYLLNTYNCQTSTGILVYNWPYIFNASVKRAPQSQALYWYACLAVILTVLKIYRCVDLDLEKWILKTALLPISHRVPACEISRQCANTQLSYFSVTIFRIVALLRQFLSKKISVLGALAS